MGIYILIQFLITVKLYFVWMTTCGQPKWRTLLKCSVLEKEYGWTHQRSDCNKEYAVWPSQNCHLVSGNLLLTSYLHSLQLTSPARICSQHNMDTMTVNSIYAPDTSVVILHLAGLQRFFLLQAKIYTKWLLSSLGFRRRSISLKWH